MIFVPATPGTELKRKLQKEMDGLNMKVKVVEKPGDRLVDTLKMNVKKERVLCGDEDCMICKSKKGGSCTKPGPVYGIFCQAEGCGAVYYGESGRNGLTRSKVHVNDRRSNNPNM